MKYYYLIYFTKIYKIKEKILNERAHVDYKRLGESLITNRHLRAFIEKLDFMLISNQKSSIMDSNVNPQSKFLINCDELNLSVQERYGREGSRVLRAPEIQRLTANSSTSKAKCRLAYLNYYPQVT